jgi:dTDP-4-amino-4,6-dideoxygalactose transaminase
MKFLDIRRQYKSIEREIDQAVQKVLNSGRFILGPEVEKFEKELAKYCKVKYAIGVNSGTDALLLSLMALNIGRGDEIITTPFTFIATAEVIALAGAKPVFVDIDPKTYNIDPDKIEKYLQATSYKLKARAIIPVHLYGQPANMNKIIKVARKYKLKVIEDAAQAIGTKLMGDIGCLSFFPSKNLGAYGDGGAVLTNNKQLAEKIKTLRVHGSKIKYHHQYLGINSRLDALQAAILRVKLKYLNKWTKARQKNAQYYEVGLRNIKEVRLPEIAPGHTHIFHQYTIRVNKLIRNKLVSYLKKQGVPTQIYYPLPLHLQPVFKYLGYKRGDFPVAERSAKEVLSLPIYPELTKKNQNFIVKKIKKFYNK